VVLIGDSTALALQDGLSLWATEATNRTVGSVAKSGCGLITRTIMAADLNDYFTKGCDFALGTTLPELLTAQRPDSALIMVTIPDVTRRQWSGDEGMLASDDPRYEARMLADYQAMTQSLMAQGVRHIAWVLPPLPAEWWLGWESDQNFSAETWTVLRRVLADVEGEFPTVVQVARLDDWFVTTGAANDPAVRDDGLHLTDAGALRVMDEFLGPILLRLSAR
jgi:hypothetical protein